MEKAEKSEITLSLNNLVKTSFIVFLGLALSKVLTYVYRIIAARYFGPEDYGFFSLATIISGWFIAIATLGFSEGILRYVSIYNEQKKESKIKYLLGYSSRLLAFTSLILGALMYISATYISIHIFKNPGLIPFLQIFSISIPVTVIASPFLMSIRAFERISAYSGIYNVLQNVVKVGFLLLFILLGFGSSSLSLSYILGLAAVLLATYIYCARKLPQLFGKSNIIEKDKKDIRKELYHYSLPLLFYGILVTIMYWIDSLSIGYFKDAAAVGLYNSAAPIAMLLSLAPEIFTQLFLPMINRHYAAKRKGVIKEISKQVTKWVLAINALAFVVMAFFPEVIINLLFGADYIPAANALRILSIGALISSIGFIPLQLVSMAGKTRLVMANILIASGLNFILNVWFVPMFGISGAATATLISMCLFNLLFFWQAWKYTGIFPLRRKMLNVLIAILPSTILAWIVKSTIDNPSIIYLGLVGIAFVLLYVGTLFLLKAFDEHDKEVLNKIAGKVGLSSKI